MKKFRGAVLESAIQKLPPEHRNSHKDSGTHQCSGNGFEVCVFADSRCAGKAVVDLRGARCVCCDSHAIRLECNTISGENRIVAKLRQMSLWVREKALSEKIPTEYQQRIKDSMQTKRWTLLHGAFLQNISLSRAKARETWRRVLRKRKANSSDPTDEQHKEYIQQALNDRKRGRRRMNIPLIRSGDESMALSDIELPPPQRNKRTIASHHWIQFRSWHMCDMCGLLWESKLTPETLTTDAEEACLHQCRICKRNIEHETTHGEPLIEVPMLNDVPEALRNLSPSIVKALQDTEADCGPESRAQNNSGFRVHSTIIRFSWCQDAVLDHIRRLRNQNDVRSPKNHTDICATTINAITKIFWKSIASSFKNILRQLPKSENYG